MEDEQPPTGPEVTREDIPDWWLYAAEFPHCTSGAECAAWCTPGGHAPVRRSWYAARTLRISEIR